jgi:putative membrane protein
MINQLTPMLAQVGEWHAKNLGEALLYTALFGVVGIVLVFVGFKVFDKAITKIDLETEVSKGNVAAAVLSGAAIIAIAIIIAAAMS